jgi:hypothetical protein
MPIAAMTRYRKCNWSNVTLASILGSAMNAHEAVANLDADQVNRRAAVADEPSNSGSRLGA